MEKTIIFKDEDWEKIYQLLKDLPNVYVGKTAACRQFVEEVLWIKRSGTQWRLFPEAYSNRNTVYKHFAH